MTTSRGVSGEYAYDWRREKLVKVIEKELVLRKSKKGILHPNWQWLVRDLQGNQYKQIEYCLIFFHEIISWCVTKAGKISIEFYWKGNRRTLPFPKEEVLPIFETEL